MFHMVGQGGAVSDVLRHVVHTYGTSDEGTVDMCSVFWLELAISTGSRPLAQLTWAASAVAALAPATR